VILGLNIIGLIISHTVDSPYTSLPSRDAAWPNIADDVIIVPVSKSLYVVVPLFSSASCVTSIKSVGVV
jgi:hypothetical protein